ncbi:hypothetical protein P7C70_g8547, partial [Phenoliferia sp. Uapishka_3]
MNSAPPPSQPPPPAYMVPTNDVVPSLGKGLSPISSLMAERVSMMRNLVEEGGPKLDYILFGANERVCGVQISEEASSMQGMAVTEWRQLAEGKRTPRAVYMLYMLLESHCGPATITKEELNKQLREEYGVDVHISIKLGGAPPTDEDYEKVEAKLEEALRKEGNLVPSTRK